MNGARLHITAAGSDFASFDPNIYLELTIHVQAIAAARPPDQLIALATAAEAMSRPILQGRIDPIDVADRLQNACDAYGVVSVHGQDAVQAVLAKYLASHIRSKPIYGPDGPHAELYRPFEIDLSETSGNSIQRSSTAPAQIGSTSSQYKRRAVLVRGDQIPLKSVQWAWRHRFAFGKLALIAGDPGLGKSQIALDIVARHTTGDVWPVDGARAPLVEVLVLTAEDGLSDTVAPRLVAAGADMSKVHFLTGTKVDAGEHELFDLTRDVEALRAVLLKHPNIRVIIIDPLTAYLGDTQAQRNSQVRKTLAPLVRLIEETGVLVIGVTHLNKAQGKAMYRVLDSIAFVALGRLLHLVVPDADNPDNRKFLCDKTNIGPKPPGLTFICQQVPISTEDGEEWVSRISWGTQHIHETADQALNAEAGSTEGTTAKEDRVEFLRKLLASGPMLVRDIEQEAVNACLLQEEKSIGDSKPFWSARKALGIEPYQTRGQKSGGWVWALPQHQAPSEGPDALQDRRASDGVEGV